MASSRTQASIAFLVCLNLVFFSMVTAQTTCSIDYKLLNAANSLYCFLLAPLVEADAAICVCTALKANLFGIVVNADLQLAALLGACGKKVPTGYKCV
ncbi:Bifunctional inhibitor/lipid-transfer protein/seed storage 2S albumin superfamily protein [Euphorbia peplus]|nr:Bifunctional inhibitor/lipid-transfer protein/seed storage 2S albumin superfamily protein [Euphorbia peplus]